MLSHCSEIHFSGRLNSNLNPFYPTDSYTSIQIDIKWITEPSISRRPLQRPGASSEIPEMTNVSGHRRTQDNQISIREAFIKINPGLPRNRNSFADKTLTTKNSESCHASTKMFSHRKNLAIIRIIQGI